MADKNVQIKVLNELSEFDNVFPKTKADIVEGLQALLDGKVDKIIGKSLTTNDFTNSDKTKLDGIQAGAQVNSVVSVSGKTGVVALVKSDVGLGSVENYAVATQAEAQAGTVSNKYMTPLRVKEAITAQTASLGGGDMLKSVYDSNNNGKVDSAEIADSVPWTGVSGKPSTFTPATHSHTATDLPSGTTSAKGVVQLSTATNSASTTLAATASAVKSAFDLANGKSKLVVQATAPAVGTADIWFQEI